MKVVFNGALETKASGCVPCQRKRVTKQSMTSKKKFFLQSGSEKLFYAGRVAEVSDDDGEKLLEYTYIDASGVPQNMFTRVD